MDIADQAADAVLQLRDLFAPQGIQILEFNRVEESSEAFTCDATDLQLSVRIPRRPPLTTAQ